MGRTAPSLPVAAPPRPRRRARATAKALVPRQIAWLGALVVASQLPHLPSVPVWVSVLGVAVVALRFLLLHRDRKHPGAPPTRPPAWVLALGAVGVAAAVYATFGFLLGREPCIAFLFVLVAIKFLEVRDARDGVLLVCLASFLLVTPFFYSQSMLAAIAAAPAVLLIGAALDVLTRGGDTHAAAESWKAPVLRALRLLLHGVPLAAVLFLLFPRLAAPLWGLPADRSAQSGLSDRMAPGMISELSLSDAIAFRVDFDGAIPPPSQRYWRGPVLSRFDGHDWALEVQRIDGALVRTNGPSIGYTVTLEPHSKPWLFALELPSTLPQPESEADSLVTQDVALLTRSQQLLARRLVTQPLRYRQRSILADRYPAVAASDAAENLRLPRGRRNGNPQTIAFAQELRATHPDEADYIRAVLAWFRNENFVYTLSPPLLDADPVDAFLFDARRGFCEHYASAFVVLLRAAGIPARIVTGYQGGEINPRGGYMIVRQSDAHAWAEALLDGQWRRFDPTAAVSPSRIEVGLGGALPMSDDVPMLARLEVGWIKAVELAWDAVNHDWRRHVIGFNRDHQRSLWRDWNIDRLAGWQYGAMLSGVAFAWVALVLAWLAWQRNRRDRVRAHWLALCARLARAGLPRMSHEGPLAYTERAAKRWPRHAADLHAIGAAYARLRYGPESARPDTDRARLAALGAFERAIRALPAASRLRANT